jgi:hypothetical protein
MPDLPASNSHPDRPPRWPLPALLIGGFLAWAIPLWACRFMRARGAYDQLNYHIKAIGRFASQWPHFDFSNYESATTPGYHVVMAGLSKPVGDTPVVLQIVASAFTLALLWLVGTMLARRAAASGISLLAAAALGLPIVCSMYVIFPGIWLQPDNASWLGVMAILALVLKPRRDVGWMIAGASVLAALVFVRQNHLWTASLLWVAAWLNAAPGNFTRPARRIPPLLLAVALTLPAVAIVASFAHLWHGLVPPDFQKQHGTGLNAATADSQGQFHPGFNFATPAFVLSLIAIYSVFLSGWLWEKIVVLWQESRPIVYLSALAGAVAAALPATTFLNEARKGGLWNFVQLEDRFHLVIAGHTSPLILILSTVGAVCLAGWLFGLASRDRLIFMTALAAFTAAQTANANCWQRYIEPFLLIVLALMALSSSRPEGYLGKIPRLEPILAPLRLLGPIVLAVGLTAVTAYSLITSEPLRW